PEARVRRLHDVRIALQELGERHFRVGVAACGEEALCAGVKLVRRWRGRRFSGRRRRRRTGRYRAKRAGVGLLGRIETRGGWATLAALTWRGRSAVGGRRGQ